MNEEQLVATVAKIADGNERAMKRLLMIQQDNNKPENVGMIHFLFKNGLAKACLGLYKYPEDINNAPKKKGSQYSYQAVGKGLPLQVLANVTCRVPGYDLDFMRKCIIEEAGNIIKIISDKRKLFYGSKASYLHIVMNAMSMFANSLLSSTKICKPLLLNVIDPEMNIGKVVMDIFLWDEKNLIKNYSMMPPAEVSRAFRLCKLAAITFLNDYIDEPFINENGEVSKESERYLIKLSELSITIKSNVKKNKKKKNKKKDDRKKSASNQQTITMVQAFLRFLECDFYSGLAMRAMEEASYIFQMFCRCTPNSAEPHLLDMNGGGKKTIVILKDRVWDRFMRNIDNYGAKYIRETTKCIICALIGYGGSTSNIKDVIIATFIRLEGFALIFTLLLPKVLDFESIHELLDCIQYVRLQRKTSKALLWAKEQVLDAIGMLKASRDYTQRPYSKDIRKVAKRVETLFGSLPTKKTKNSDGKNVTTSNGGGGGSSTAGGGSSTNLKVNGSSKKTCIYCMNIVDIPKLCGRCKKVYCSKECQIKDWKEGGHKRMCKIYQKELEKKENGYDGMKRKDYKKFQGNLSDTGNIVFQNRYFSIFLQADLMELDLLDCVFVIDLRESVPLAFPQLKKDFISQSKEEGYWEKSTDEIVKKNERRDFMSGFVFSYSGGDLGSSMMMKTYPPLTALSESWKTILTKAKILNPSYNSMYEMAKLCISKGMTKKSILDILQKVDYLEIMETLIKVAVKDGILSEDITEDPQFLGIMQSGMVNKQQ